MPIVDARDLFKHAAGQRYRLPLAAPDGVDAALAWIGEAGRHDAPLVLDLIDRPGRPPWDIAFASVEMAADRSPAPVVMHRGGIASESDLAAAIRIGCGAITAAPAAAPAAIEMAETLGVAVLPREGAGSAFPNPDSTAPDAPIDGESSGRGPAALAACGQWRPVEHVVMFNPEGLSDEGVGEMLRIGTDMLASIPGVRTVRTGTALTAGANYALSWFVRFANERVLAHYRDHPTHVAFADGHFRPFAGDRMTIDFKLT